MEEVCNRFPHLAEEILEKLDYQSLTKFKMANKRICDFLTPSCLESLCLFRLVEAEKTALQRSQPYLTPSCSVNLCLPRVRLKNVKVLQNIVYDNYI